MLDPSTTLTAGNSVQITVSGGPSGTSVGADDQSTDADVSNQSASASSCNGAFVGDIGATKGRPDGPTSR